MIKFFKKVKFILKNVLLLLTEIPVIVRVFTIINQLTLIIIITYKYDNGS